jgi:hypothetical protein
VRLPLRMLTYYAKGKAMAFRDDGTYERDGDDPDSQEEFDTAFIIMLPQTLDPMEVHFMIHRAVDAAYAPDPYIKPELRPEHVTVRDTGPELAPEPQLNHAWDTGKSYAWAEAAAAVAAGAQPRRKPGLLRKLRYVAQALNPWWQQPDWRLRLANARWPL